MATDKKALITLCCAMTLLAGCAHSPTYDPLDPLEPVNRATYRFNEVFDHYLLRPVAIAYDWAVPGFAKTGVRNFFNNLEMPIIVVNDVLQGKGDRAFLDSYRLLINTTVGVGGLYDAAGRHWKIYHQDEDFGQTLGSWGVGQGWYLVIPFLGPSTNRDAVGRIFDAPLNPLVYLDEDEQELAWGLTALDVVDTRARLLPAEKVLRQQPDRYSFVRGTYLQRRRSAVYDGNPPREDLGFEPED